MGANVLKVARCIFILFFHQLSNLVLQVVNEVEVMQTSRFVFLLWHRTHPSFQPAGWQMYVVGDKRTG